MTPACHLPALYLGLGLGELLGLGQDGSEAGVHVGVVELVGVASQVLLKAPHAFFAHVEEAEAEGQVLGLPVSPGRGEGRGQQGVRKTAGTNMEETFSLFKKKKGLGRQRLQISHALRQPCGYLCVRFCLLQILKVTHEL